MTKSINKPFDLKSSIKEYNGIRIATELGLTKQAVYMWERVPAHHVLKVAELLDETPHRIRPDIYPANWNGAGV